MPSAPLKLLTHATFWLGPGLPPAHSVLVSEGRIQSLNPASPPPGAQRIDLGGAFVTPALHDAHLHAFWVGDGLLRQADLTGATTIAEALDRLRDHAARRPGGWLISRGFDQEKVAERRFPTAAELDAVGGGRQTIVLRVCGHAGAVSSALVQGESDQVTGNVLVEHTLWNTLRTVPALSDAELEQAALLTFNLCRDRGLGAVGTMLEEFRQFDALIRLAERGQLPIHVTVNFPGANAADVAARGFRTGSRIDSGTGHGCPLTVGAAKFFSDGSFGARTALLTRPYSDDPSTAGLELMSRAAMTQTFARVAAMDFQIATHAIGDAALRNVLAAYEPLCQSGNPLRHRIEHATLCPRDCVEALARLQIVTVVQPQFIQSDVWLPQRLGLRIADAYPFGALQKAGIPLSLSSDAPVETIDPQACLTAAETRLSRDDALAAYTQGSAFASHVEDLVGSFSPGKRAVFSIHHVGRLSLLSL